MRSFNSRKKLFILLLMISLFGPCWNGAAQENNSQENSAARRLEEQRRDTMRFGTETEIAALIQTLRSEKVSYLDAELLSVAQKTRNKSILTEVFGFFGEMEKAGLEDRAIRAVVDRVDEANDTVIAAVNYLGQLKVAKAVDCLEELILSGENRFLSSAFRAIGLASAGYAEPSPVEESVNAGFVQNPLGSDEENAEGNDVIEESGAESAAVLNDRIALFLLDHYKNRNPGDESKREIIVSLGETGSKEAVSFLSGLIKNPDERPVLRMAALDAISKIGDEEGLDAVIESVNSSDPNVRSTAVGALGPFSGGAVDNAILEAFRDSYYRTRMGAALSAGKRGMVSAIPFLRFRAENDDVPAVKDEAIKALGAINNEETMGILDSLFTERKNSDRVRILTAEMLLRNNADKYGPRVFLEMDEAKKKNQTPLYNGFIRVMGNARAPSLESITRQFISGGGVIEKSLALDLVALNEFRGLEEDVRTLLDEKKNGASIARKAKSTLERLGLD